MKRIFTILFIFLYSCAEKPVVNPNFDFSQMKTIVIYPTPDYRSFTGSGSIINKSIVYHLMKMGLNVVERETTPVLIKEAALTQTGITNNTIDINLTSSDVVFLCTVTEFKDYKVIIIPVITEHKGSTVTTVETVDEPIVSRDKEGNEIVYYETTTTEIITIEKGSMTETERIKYVPSRVGVAAQLLNAGNGDVLWTNTYWYTSLSLSNAVNECVFGVLKPLKKLLN